MIMPLTLETKQKPPAEAHPRMSAHPALHSHQTPSSSLSFCVRREKGPSVQADPSSCVCVWEEGGGGNLPPLRPWESSFSASFQTSLFLVSWFLVGVEMLYLRARLPGLVTLRIVPGLSVPGVTICKKIYLDLRFLARSLVLSADLPWKLNLTVLLLWEILFKMQTHKIKQIKW